MAKDLIRFDLLVQDALKGVVRRVLGNAVKDGLLGEHHFYISFRTEFPGVRLSQRLRDKYPQEMTIVLQHQFWDLGVTEHAFEVGLSFSGIPERLLIPFDALTGFFDPSVSFGLKFEVQSETGRESAAAPSPGPHRLTRGAGSEPVELQPRKPAVPSIAKSAAPRSAPAKSPSPKGVAPRLAVKPSAEATPGAPKPEKPEKPAKPDAAQPSKDKVKDEAGGTGEVVSLDSFRKKN